MLEGNFLQITKGRMINMDMILAMGKQKDEGQSHVGYKLMFRGGSETVISEVDYEMILKQLVDY